MCAGECADNGGMEDLSWEDLSLKAGGAAPGNGRRYPRYPIHLPICVREASVSADEAGESEPDTVQLRDISLTGFCFLSARPYESESRLEIEIAFGGREYQIKALVQRCVASSEDKTAEYGVAVLFLRGGDIHAFIADTATYLNRLS